MQSCVSMSWLELSADKRCLPVEPTQEAPKLRADLRHVQRRIREFSRSARDEGPAFVKKHYGHNARCTACTSATRPS